MKVKQLSVLKFLKKRNLPILFFAIPGIFILFTYFTGYFTEVTTKISRWPVTLANFAIILGVFTLIRYHATAISRKREEWIYSAITLISLFITFGSSLIYQPGFDWITTNIIQIGSIAIVAFVGFYNYTLFYRAARARTFEVTLLIVCCIFVMFWMAPIGAAIHPALPVIGKWINDVPNGGAMRGILIVIAVGMIGLFIRAMLGYEKSYLGGE